MLRSAASRDRRHHLACRTCGRTSAISEPALQRWVREHHPASLARYLFYEYVPAPHSIWDGMHKLPAAHALVWERETTSIAR